MISFDNRPQMLVHPVSSIDFGFAGLAYAVAHLFNADLPVRVDRRRRIMSTPFVADRGSVGRRPRVVDKKSVGVHRYACENATAIPPAPSP